MPQLPGRLNLLLVLLTTGMQFALLVLASQCVVVLGRSGWWWVLAVSIPFSFLFLTVYALMHEASHGILHANRQVNRWLGAWCGLFFPTSATMMRITHAVHHRCNRTDHEMFDCYYAGDRRWLKRAQWYSILLGGFYLIIPFGAVIIAWGRPLLLTKPFKGSRSASVLYDDFTASAMWMVRLESTLCIAFYVVLFATGLLSPWPTALLFLAGGLNWSTRQYVTHAWSPREVIDGAHDLQVNPLMRRLLLNGHLDLVHHRYPTAPWHELPALVRGDRAAIPFWRQYLSQWAGPRLTAVPGPPPLPDLVAERAA